MNKFAYVWFGETMKDIFGEWWLIYQFKTEKERFSHFDSLSKAEQNNLKHSLFADGWYELICQNQLDQILDSISHIHNIDLIDLRIKTIKLGKITLIERAVWEEIENMTYEYGILFGSELIFGGLKIEPWGKRDRFIKISAQRKGLFNG